jgi:hypothetical protein
LYDHILLASNLFKKGQVIKKACQPDVLPVTMPLVTPPPGPAQFPQYPAMFNPYMFNPMAAYTMGMPGAMGVLGMLGMMGMLMNNMPDQKHTPPNANCSSSLIHAHGDVHSFCVDFRIGEDVEQCLDQLSFMMGDNLDEVMEQEYKDAGFKALAWKRVLKAYKKHKCATKA